MKGVLLLVFCFLANVLIAGAMSRDGYETIVVEKRIEDTSKEMESPTFRMERTIKLHKILLEKETMKKRDEAFLQITTEEAPAKKIDFVYVTKKGDMLCKIAKKYGTTVKNILFLNSDIKDPGIIGINQKIQIGAVVSHSEISNVKSRKMKKVCFQVSLEEKISILKEVEKRTQVPWEVLAGLAKQESELGAKPVGDHGRSHGYFHINFLYHKGITLAQANDWEWSSNWAADFLVKLGFNNDPIKAMRRWNGSLENPKTLEHVESVLHLAKRNFGLDDRYDSLLDAKKYGGGARIVNAKNHHRPESESIVLASFSGGF